MIISGGGGGPSNRAMFVVAFLVTLAIVCPLVRAGVPSENLIQWSFVNCQSDILCAAALPSGADAEIFSEMIFMYFSMRADSGDSILPLIEPCLQPVLPVDPCENCTVTCAQIQTMWIGAMREAHVCRTNEEWVSGECRCIEGKNCHEDCIAERSVSASALFGFGSVALLVSVSLAAWILHGEKKTNKDVERLDRDVFHQRQELAREVYARKSARPVVDPALASAAADP